MQFIETWSIFYATSFVCVCVCVQCTQLAALSQQSKVSKETKKKIEENKWKKQFPSFSLIASLLLSLLFCLLFLRFSTLFTFLFALSTQFIQFRKFWFVRWTKKMHSFLYKCEYVYVHLKWASTMEFSLSLFLDVCFLVSIEQSTGFTASEQMSTDRRLCVCVRARALC